MLNKFHVECKQTARLYRSAELRVLNRHEIHQLPACSEIKRFNTKDARSLGQRLYLKHAGHNRAAGEMSLKKAFVELALSRLDAGNSFEDAVRAGVTAILCSPHNPNGRVWTRAELEGFADLARRHGLTMVSDEIHHDLVYPGHTHIPMAEIMGPDGLVMMTATTKTFNIAGAHSGNVIVEDGDLRSQFARRMAALGVSPNSFGLFMAEAAYTPAGAEWVDGLMAYLDGNRQVFDAGVNAIPGLRSVPLEATYLSWVDFDGTGMTREEFTARVERDARIAVNHGPTFGKGGDRFLRFNIATPRSNVEDAVERLHKAFADLQ